jgi:hypothetical protein
LRTLFVINLALCAGFTALTYRVIERGAGRLAAWLGALVFLGCFAFGQQVGIGNYNWVAPYSHELTHGVLLGLVALACWARFQRGGGAIWAALWGLASGLAFLTKPETALAALCALLAACLATLAVGRRKGSIWIALACALAPTVLACLLLNCALSWREAGGAALGAWRGLFELETAHSTFYRTLSGFDRPLDNLALALRSLAGWLALLVPCVVASFALRGSSRGRWLALPAAAASAGAWLFLRERLPPIALGRALPILLGACVAAAAFGTLRSVWRTRNEPGLARACPSTERLPFAVWSFALLAKMLLAARLSQYGFALAAPAVLFAVAALAGWWPGRAERGGRSPWIARGAMVGLALVLIVHCLSTTNRFLARKTYAVGSGADRVRADLRGSYVAAALGSLAEQRQPGETLVVLPEGATLNHWSGAPNPTPYLNFMPPELALFGEEPMLDALRRAAPDWLILVHKDTSEYGVPFFGRDYARSFAPWIAEHYVTVQVFGDKPLVAGARFGVALLRRR